MTVGAPASIGDRSVEPGSLARDIAATLLPGFEGTTLPEPLAERLRGGLGGVCLFGMNIDDPEQLRSLNASVLAANPLAVIAIDEEGGDVTRLYQDVGSPFPGNAVLGRLDDVSLTRAVGEQVGRELRAVGCTLALAPSVDVNCNPDNPVIGVRSFGAEPELVARHGAAWVDGLRSAAVEASVKHFPGHGDTAVDSHVGLPVIDRSLAELRERELIPFAAAVRAGTETVMTSHILLPQLDQDAPATLSRPILQGLLRDELGFDGVIVSDALDMTGASGEIGIPEAAVRALAAGCDLLCIGTRTSETVLQDIVESITNAVDDGRLPRERVAEAAERVRRMQRLGAARRAASSATGSTSGPSVPETAVARAFAVTTRAAELLPSLSSVGSPLRVLRLDSPGSVALGPAPWGPFPLWADAAGESAGPNVEPAGAGDIGAVDIVTVDEDSAPDFDPADAPGSAGETLVVIGRDLDRHDWAGELIARVRAARASVLVVDVGWPGTTAGGAGSHAGAAPTADIATFGGSRLVGAALIAVLDGRIRP